MSRGPFTTSNYFRAESGLSHNGDTTFAAWVYPTTGSGTLTIGGSCDDDSVYGQRVIWLTSGAAQSYQRGDSGAGVYSPTHGAANINDWNLICGLFTSSGTNVWFNGSKPTPTAGGAAPTVWDHTTIGAWDFNGGRVFPFTGYIAMCGVWSTLLSESEMDSLYGDVLDFRCVERDYLTNFWECKGTEGVTDRPGALDMIENGTVIEQNEHPDFVRLPHRFLVQDVRFAPSVTADVVFPNGV